MQTFGTEAMSPIQAKALKVEKGRDITAVVKDNLCMGCGTCASLCPFSAIDLVKDNRKSSFVAIINRKRCTKCGICFAVCPGRAVDVPQLSEEFLPDTMPDVYLGGFLNCYLGHATNHKIRYQRSTGGMVTEILLYALENAIIDGALVVRMPADGKLTPQPYIARCSEDILASAKSLYCPVPANLALKEILKTPGRYAVVGIPCHLHGIRKAELLNKKLRRRIVLHLGLFCAWGTPFNGTDFVLDKLGIKRSYVKSVAYRGEGFPGGFIVELVNGNKIRLGMYEGWDRNLSAFKVNRCLYCHDKSAELADISFADAWLPEITATDTIGTNVSITRTRLAEDILKQMKEFGRITLTFLEKEKYLKSIYFCRWKKIDISGRIKFAQLFGIKIPLLGRSTFPTPSVRCLLDAAVQYLQMLLSSRKALWWLLKLSSRLIDAADEANLYHISPTKKELSGE